MGFETLTYYYIHIIYYDYKKHLYAVICDACTVFLSSNVRLILFCRAEYVPQWAGAYSVCMRAGIKIIFYIYKDNTHTHIHIHFVL